MKRLLLNHSVLFFFLFLLVNTFGYAQTGRVSGVIEDKDGVPLPGVNIVVKGSNTGTQTDFDGNYRIKCDVGDILVISYIGQRTREVKVTAAMFGVAQRETVIQSKAVETILDTTYQKEVRKNIPSFLLVPSIEESPKTHNGRSSLQMHRIKEISKKGNKVNLTYFDPDIFYEVGASSLAGVQFVQQRNLPALQNRFAQGTSMNGTATYFPPESNIPFSYGPALNSLEFDGSNYPFDTNGSLVSEGSGNGRPAKRYDNNPFQTVFKSSNSLFMNVSTEDQFFEFDFLTKSGKDIYNQERSNLNEYTLKYNNEDRYSTVTWDAQLKHVKSTENQPNLNGFQNNLLLSALATPITFSNEQGGTLEDGSQRSFSPMNYNNPDWLLNSNRNQLENDVWLATLSNNYDIWNNVTINSKLGYTYSNSVQHFGLYKNTVGFEDGYRSDKALKKDTFDANINIDWRIYLGGSKLDVVSSFRYQNENLAYRFSESTGFNERTFNSPQSTTSLDRDISLGTFRWLTKLDFSFLDHNAHISVINNAFYSTKQDGDWFLPTIQLSYEFGDLLYSEFIKRLDLSASMGYDVNALDLFYSNQSHNALQFNPDQSFSYTANNDLFVSREVAIEERKSYEVSLNFGFRLFEEQWNLSTTYYSNTTEGSVFPVWENNQYNLRNVANIRNAGIECTFEGWVYTYDDFRFIPSIVFSTYDSEVKEILTSDSRIPIAGFSSISKNLIVGQPAGVLVGTAYQRDNQNNVASDAAGFPLVAPELQIVGDPIPDFNIGFSSTFQWKGFQLDFVLDYQKGGDVWNGTQNVLNYLGRSQQSALERVSDNSVFDTYQQYDFEGVAEDAIVDGSYFNFKSFNLSYNLVKDKERPFFREAKIGVYGLNLFTTAAFRGAAPYSNMFDQTAGQGLQFFNSPILSEVGLKINFKI